jgi:hypothetical protein
VVEAVPVVERRLARLGCQGHKHRPEAAA